MVYAACYSEMRMYEDLTDEQLATEVSHELGLEYETALRAVVSDNPALGRDWARSILRRVTSLQETQARLTEYSERLRSVAASG